MTLATRYAGVVKLQGAPGNVCTVPRAYTTNLIREIVMPAKYTPEQRIAAFWSKVNKDGPTTRPELAPCWVWTAHTDTCGYGRVALHGRLRKAHVVAYILTTGHEPPPETPQILHHCDNPPCVRPEHLYAGTPRSNMADMLRRGRSRSIITSAQDHFRSGHAPNGARSGGAKLTAEQAAEILRRRRNGEGCTALGREFGVNRDTIRRLVNGETWPDLDRGRAAARCSGCRHVWSSHLRAVGCTDIGGWDGHGWTGCGCNLKPGRAASREEE